MLHLRLERRPSPIGTMVVITEGERLRVLDFEDYGPRMERLLTRHYGPVALEEGAAPAAIDQALTAYFDGEAEPMERIETATPGTDFQRTVWAALRTIPHGHTWSYGRLAAAIGKPGASRAVGLANGANPIAIVVPCHRVIGANDTLTGYGGGLHRKRWLLEHEGVALKPERAASPPDLFETAA